MAQTPNRCLNRWAGLGLLAGTLACAPSPRPEPAPAPAPRPAPAREDESGRPTPMPRKDPSEPGRGTTGGAPRP